MTLPGKTLQQMQKDIRTIFNAGVAAVAPEKRVKYVCRTNNYLLKINHHSYDLSSYKHIYVIGAGKASAAMGTAIEDLIGKRLTGGLINVKYGYTAPLKKIRLIEAGHPLPDENGLRPGGPYRSAQRGHEFLAGTVAPWREMGPVSPGHP